MTTKTSMQDIADHLGISKNAVSLALNQKAVTKYKSLTEAEVQSLVIDDKWGAKLERQINGAVTALGQTLIERLGVLSVRYRAPIVAMEHETATFSGRMIDHLRAMGVSS